MRISSQELREQRDRILKASPTGRASDIQDPEDYNELVEINHELDLRAQED